MLAQLTAAVVNFSMCHPKKPVKATDYMPSRWSKEEVTTRKRRKLSAKQLEAKVRLAFAAFK